MLGIFLGKLDVYHDFKRSGYVVLFFYLNLQKVEIFSDLFQKYVSIVHVQ